ncbi:ABC transporter permease [Couchioplanes azureus]|uniref:ABC transporter permease n=1 Tax=Couchioplanes caeruleus TaxID=56438 RepID=UPI0016705897|nr:ABC transporter permease [Couchioplanes caeruleus]GGQ57939.1 ABC transporter permease [Couchioplanes caeruleus subsp. azureus]
MTTFQAVQLVAARELRVKLRDKTFIFSTVFFLFIAVASTVLPALFDGGPTKVAVSTGTAGTAPQRAGLGAGTVGAALQGAGLDVRTVADDAAAERALRDGDVEAAVVAGPTVLAMEEAPSEVVGALSAAPSVRLLEGDESDPFLKFIVPFALAFLFFITSFTFGLQIAQSVTEEKQTRIVEILVASVPVRALLAGKVAALTLLAFGQIALIALVATIGMRIADLDAQMVSQVGPAIGWFLPYFVLGFVMLATLWAGVGALVARQEDIAGASTPLQMAVMLPFFAALFLTDNEVAMRILSYIPLSSPIAMPIRLFNDEAAGWEPIVSLGLLAVAAVIFLGIGARIYEGSLLRTNGRTSLAAAWRSRSAVG